MLPRRALTVAAGLVLLLLGVGEPAETAIPLSTFKERLDHGAVASVTVGEDVLHGRFTTPQQIGAEPIIAFRAELPRGTTANWQFTQWLLDNANGAQVIGDNHQDVLLTILVPLIPWILIFGFLWFFIFRQMRKRGAALSIAGTAPVPPESDPR